MPTALNLFATTPRGIAPLLADELTALGAEDVRPREAGVAFSGNLALAYRACLWSRLASRILLQLAEFPAPDGEALYAGVQAVDWGEHLAAEGSLAVDVSAVRPAIGHTRYALLRVKDAVVDQFRAAAGVRPDVRLERPDLRLHLHLQRDRAHLSIDLSGESLHRRGYRGRGVAAPLKENLAAAILLRAGWPEVAAAGGPLVDPMCGSGTLPIEAALMAADCAPGLAREHFGFLGWRGHRPELWTPLLEEAHARRAAGLKRLPPILGCDQEPAAVAAARENVALAGLQGHVRIEEAELGDVRPPAPGPGLVAVNPPYGERLGEEQQLGELYTRLGRLLAEHFDGWRLGLFTGNPALGLCLGLRARRSYTLFNGPIECRLLTLTVEEKARVAPRPAPGAPPMAATGPLSDAAQMLANRLRKNLRTLGRWARREGVNCYRLYDADLPEFAFALDLYRDNKLWVHLQEYQPPASVDRHKAERRLAEAQAAVAEVLEIPPGQIFVKVRQRQKGTAQYERHGSAGTFHEVREGAAHLLVNFTDYLDTGLFLDHRTTRRMVGELARGRDFLNLFCYTGTATVHAGLGGARSTTSVDMSRTYLDWARRNLTLNGLTGPKHRLVQADAITWLEEAAARPARYGLIFLDPPTFSNSKRMEATLDVQRDHPRLIRLAAALLSEDGVLLFSTNRRRFSLDTAALAGLSVEEISRRTVPPDFARTPRIHHCYRITRAPQGAA